MPKTYDVQACSKCNGPGPFAYRSSKCRRCACEYQKQWRLKNIEKVAPKERARSKRDKAKLAASAKAGDAAALEEVHKDRERTRLWRKENPDISRKINRDRNEKIRLEVVAAYGGRCSCPRCGETEPAFLTIDHVDNDGAEHRRQLGGKSGVNMYRVLKKLGFPKDRFRLMCFNCNCGRHRNGGVCPHERA